ncbi:hypothetical protein RN001_008381 [Aquatica leii]|uniref:Uncharacterized protein n=1 Tax=Aquatica leii TaxID=1421715 RepID=A0AAN7Q542_9COLE|nr:hypothetical protein RN001_008381 [Aquatica leii]
MVKTLTDWKSKTKLKAATLIKDKFQTGGGPSKAINLTQYEERLLQIMGKSSYEGNPINIERGFRKRKLIDLDNVAQIHHTRTTDHDYTIKDTDSITIETEEPLQVLPIFQSSQFYPRTSITNSDTIVPIHHPPSPQLNIFTPSTSTTTCNQQTPTSNNTKTNKRHIKTQQTIKTTETFTKMHDDLLKELKTLNVTLTTMSDSLRDIADTLKI